jgi:small-conductance mechanosensitive channel
MMAWLSTLLPDWAVRLVMSVLMIALAYLGSLLARRIVIRRLSVLAQRTTGKWDDVLIAELSRRVPFWGLLLGVYLAAGYWQLRPQHAALLEKTLFIAAAASVTMLAATFAAALAREYGPKVHGDIPTTSLMQNVIKLLVIALGLLTILSGLGVSITPLLTTLGVGGLAVALALQDTLANLFAGFYVTVARQIRVGDYLRLDTGDEGFLWDIGWRSSRLRTQANNMIVIPNSKLAQAIITNYDMPDKEIPVPINLRVDYGSDLDNIERVAREVAADVLQTTPGGVATFEPVVRFHTFGESSIDCTVILRAREFTDQYLLKHEFVKRLHQKYAKEGIRMPFPVRAVLARADESDAA